MNTRFWAVALVIMMAHGYANAAVSDRTVKYCDNDNYWDTNGNCVSCPEPTGELVYIDEYGDKISIAGGKSDGDCGYGTMESNSVGIESCLITKGANDGPDCVYCDDTGCFVLTDDCHYSY